MITLLLIAAVAGAGPAEGSNAPPAVTAVQATATVRILAGERISAGVLPQSALVRDTRIRSEDGIERNARLVEFP